MVAGSLAQPKRHYVPAVSVPGTRRRLLTEARKMPCLSWSLPARKSCPHALFKGQQHGHGTICGSCYAMGGNYARFKHVAASQDARFAWVRKCLKTEGGRTEYVKLMVRTIRRGGLAYFRVHDAGDLFSPAYIRCWTRIVRELPGIKFWIPTRAWRALTATYKGDPANVKALAAFKATQQDWALALMELAGQPNVTMRPSALFFNAPAPRIPGMAAGTTARETGFTCPASLQGNACLECRVCWDEPDVEVGYHKSSAKVAAA